jgi:hypothetical protein
MNPFNASPLPKSTLKDRKHRSHPSFLKVKTLRQALRLYLAIRRYL